MPNLDHGVEMEEANETSKFYPTVWTGLQLGVDLLLMQLSFHIPTTMASTILQALGAARGEAITL